MRIGFPRLRLRMWHLIGLVAAVACFLAVMQFRRETEDPGYRWMRQLRSSDAARRAEAARELAQLRPAERQAIAPLTEALFDPDARVRIDAARALMNILRVKDDPEAGPVMAAMASALRDPDPGTRYDIAEVLAHFQPESKVIVPTLLEAATKGDGRQRAHAMLGLERYARESEPVRDALFAGLGDTDPTVRRLAVESLISCATYPDLAPEPLFGRIKDTLLVAAGDPDPFVRSGAVRALGRLGDRTKTEFPVLIEALGDPDADVRLQAATYLAWRSIGTRSPALIPALGRSLKDPDKHVRRAAARTLGRLGPNAEATLRESPVDPDQDVRQEVAAAIATIEKAAVALRSMILEGIANLGDADPAIRALGADQLARCGSRAAEGIPALVRGLGDREASVRLAAAVALRELGPPAAVALPDLARCAESDDDERVRRAAKASRSSLLREQDGSLP